MIRCEKHKDLLLCSINTCSPPPSVLPLSCRRDVFIYLRALFKNKIKAFHRAFAQLLLLLEKKKVCAALICSGSEKEAGRRAWCRALISQVGWMHNSWALKLSADCSRADTESPSRTSRCRCRCRARVCSHMSGRVDSAAELWRY